MNAVQPTEDKCGGMEVLKKQSIQFRVKNIRN